MGSRVGTCMVGLVLALSGCDQNLNLGTQCNAKTCKGCCDDQGVCQLGQADNQCGANGGMCLSCEGQQCLLGVCQPVAGTGGGSDRSGGGSGGAGGGTGGFGGGQVGRLDQELVSGTRLKAVRRAGADGSRLSVAENGALFWDEQLEQFCSVGTSSGLLYRLPTYQGSVYEYCWPAFFRQVPGESIRSYADLNCSTPLAVEQWYELRSDLGRSPKFTYTQGNRSDGGTGLYPTYVAHRGNVYRPSDAGCQFSAATDGGQYVVATGIELRLSDLVHFSEVIE